MKHGINLDISFQIHLLPESVVAAESEKYCDTHRVFTIMIGLDICCILL